MTDSFGAAPILAVGCERSGNTWIGRMLAAAPRTYGLYQPFNGDSLRPATPRRWPFTAKDQYIGPDNEQAFLGPVRQLLKPRIPPEYALREAARAALGHLPVREAAQRYLTTMKDVIRARVLGFRPVMGDPGGIFLAEWLADRFGARIVCVIRHPCGVAAGFKRMGWTRDMSDLLDQPLLMETLLEGWDDALQAWNARHEAGTATWLGQATLWWNLVGHVMAGYRQRRDDFLFVRYEDLAADPVPAFRKLYGQLGLDFTPQVEQTIAQHTQRAVPETQLGQDMHVLKRNSQQAAESWRQRLEPDEIAQVREQTARVADTLELELAW